MDFEVRYRVEDIPQVVARLVPLLQEARVVLLYGTLGAGKTTLVKVLLEALGVKGVVNSPTFAYVNRYEGASRVIYHFDLYRIGTLDGFLCQGFDEYINEPVALSIIEWPHILENWLSEQPFDSQIYSVELGYSDQTLDERLLSVKKLSKK